MFSTHQVFIFFLFFFPWEGGGAGGRGFLIYFLIHEVDVYMYIHYYPTGNFSYILFILCAHIDVCLGGGG